MIDQKRIWLAAFLCVAALSVSLPVSTGHTTPTSVQQQGTSFTSDTRAGINSAATRSLEKKIGAENWTKLLLRLEKVNGDIVARGIRSFPGTTDKLLTGYPYNEYYDWDLYFENVYLTYFGIDEYCFTNLKMFLDRQQPDGYVNRSLIKQRDRQHFKPFLAQLAVMGSKMRSDNYEWARATYYDKLKKYLERWFAYDFDHNGLPVWNSATIVAWIINGAALAIRIV